MPFVDPDGNEGFNALYGSVVFTDLLYNKISTLLCDYYDYANTSSIVYNLYLINGLQQNISNVKVLTDSAWANKVSMTCSSSTQNLTDDYAATAEFAGPYAPDTITPVTITINSTGITGSTTIPIYVLTTKS